MTASVDSVNLRLCFSAEKCACGDHPLQYCFPVQHLLAFTPAMVNSNVDLRLCFLRLRDARLVTTALELQPGNISLFSPRQPWSNGNVDLRLSFQTGMLATAAFSQKNVRTPIRLEVRSRHASHGRWNPRLEVVLSNRMLSTAAFSQTNVPRHVSRSYPNMPAMVDGRIDLRLCFSSSAQTALVLKTSSRLQNAKMASN